MHIRDLFIFLALVLLTSNAVLAYGLGMSPVETDVCVIPGQVRNVTFSVTMSDDVTQGPIEVYLSGVGWVYSNEYLELPPKGEPVLLDVTIYTPEDIQYGVRTVELLVCAPKKLNSENFPIQPCVEGNINIDVEETCPEIEAQKEVFRNTVRDYLLIAIFVLVLVYLGRKVGKTKLKKKRQVRRTKIRKKTKRRKK